MFFALLAQNSGFPIPMRGNELRFLTPHHAVNHQVSNPHEG